MVTNLCSYICGCKILKKKTRDFSDLFLLLWGCSGFIDFKIWLNSVVCQNRKKML